MSKIMLLGPLSNKSDMTKTGGVIILFQNLIKYCDAHRINYIVIDTNKSNYNNKIIAYFIILYIVLRNITNVSHISLHGTANDYILIAPYIVFLGKLFHKHVSLRKFAGNFNEIYNNASFLKQLIIKKTLQYSSCNFFETKYLRNYFKDHNRHTYWFPNVRSRQSRETSKTTFQKRFVFIGHVKKEKGIYDLLEVSNMLDPSYTLDIYGSLVENIVFDEYKAEYKGVLRPDEVIDTMRKYDVLLLPSYREGYPGVVIEALSVGLPVVATKLQGISEMLDDESSILIEAKNCKELKQAIESFNSSNYDQKSLAAIRQFKQFDTDVQTTKFFERIGFVC